jgi:hypothetical protein
MALAAEDLTEIEKVLGAVETDANPVAELRQRFPQLSWIRCDASDMVEPPYRAGARFDIHLLDRSDHCVQVTADLARATGIILADRGAAS